MQIPSGAAMSVAAIYFSAFIVSSCAMDSAPPGSKPDSNSHTKQSNLVCHGDNRQIYNHDRNEVNHHLLHTTFIGDLAVETQEDNPKDIRQKLNEFLEEFKKFSADKPNRYKKLLIYLNGGLTSIDAARKQAANQIPCMEADGYFPAFLIWRTEPLLTYGEQIAKVRNGKINRNIQPTTPLYLAGDLGEGLARAPITFYNQTARYLDRLLFRDKTEYGVDVGGSIGQKHRYNDPSREVNADHNVIFANDVDNGRSDIGGDILYTLTSPLRLVTTPFTDSMGKTAWENMLRRSRVTVRSAWEFQPEFYEDRRTLGGAPTSRDELIRIYERGTGAFSRFFQELAWCQSGLNGCAANGMQSLLNDAEITVIGHSMGTIVLDQLLARYPKLKIRNIVYMAAATSPRSFVTRVGPYLRENRHTRFYSLMLHPLAEVRETTFGGLFPSGSLLEWIDDMYENPKTMIDRTMGKWRNIALTKHLFPPDLQDQMVFKIFGFGEGEGRFDLPNHRPPDPIIHGAFNDTRMFYWRPRFWQPDAGGLKWKYN